MYDDRPTPLAPAVTGPIAVARMDLRSGQVSTWYRAPAGDVVDLIGLDAEGLPMLRVSPETGDRITVTPPPIPPITLVVLTGPGQA